MRLQHRLSRMFLLRLISGVVLAAAALFFTFEGGILFFALWAFAALWLSQEWFALPKMPQMRAGAAIAALGVGLVALVLLLLGYVPAFFAALFLAFILGLSGWIYGKFIYSLMGGIYACILLIAPLWLRNDGGLGVIVMVWIFATVWATDTFAYFTGKLLKGPKLCPKISPAKTWSGFFGGILGGVVTGGLVLEWFGITAALPVLFLSAAFSLLCHVGDLFESMLKRRYGAKDSGALIPGHGGVMDRLDGFIAVLAGALLFGLLRGGMDAPAQGLLLWP